MSFEAFGKDIKMGLKPVYLLYGHEKYLIEQYLDILIEKYVPDMYKDFNLVVYDGEKVTLDELIDSCETVPFFSECKVIIVKNATYFRNKKANLSDAEEKRLLEYIAKPFESTHLIFVSNQSIDKRKKCTKAIDKQGGNIEFSKLNPQIFTKWVVKKIRAQEKEIDQNTLNYLIKQLAYLDKHSSKALLDVDNELKMICTSLQNRDEILPDDIDQFVKKPLDADIFMLVDAVGQKKADTAIQLMHSLLKAGEPIQVIFSMVSRQFRLLKKIKILVSSGYNQATIAKVLGLHPYVVKNIMRQIHLFKDDQLTLVLEKCSDIDYKMKSTAMDPILAIEALIVECSFIM